MGQLEAQADTPGVLLTTLNGHNWFNPDLELIMKKWKKEDIVTLKDITKDRVTSEIRSERKDTL